MSQNTNPQRFSSRHRPRKPGMFIKGFSYAARAVFEYATVGTHSYPTADLLILDFVEQFT